MNRFQKRQFHINRALLSAVLAAVFFACFLLGINAVSDSAGAQELSGLRDAVAREVVQCYALEGRYPGSLAYLEQHYGLTYNKEKYLIDYEVFGSNMMPDISVIER